MGPIAAPTRPSRLTRGEGWRYERDTHGAPLADKGPTSDAARFAARFDQLRPGILEEWPELDAEVLDGTAGELERVVALVAERTGRTRAVSRRLLRELLAEVDAPAAPPAARTPRPANREPEPPHLDALERLFTTLESHLDDLTRQVKADVAPLALDTVRQHMGMALLIAGGLGVMLGLALGALGFPHAGAEKEGGDADAS